MSEREIVGYKLEPIYKAQPGMITTHAFIMCCSCGGMVSGHGGPMTNAVCPKCVEHLLLIGDLEK